VIARACGLFALGVALAVGACARRAKDSEPQSGPAVAQTAAPGSSAAPVDHLAPGELPEGSQTAFGLVLPRDLQVRESYVDVVSAVGPVSVRALVRYLAARLEGGSLREGTQAATFEHVAARGKQGPELLVRVTSVLGGSRLEIHKVTHLPASDLPDEASRWRQVGLTPEGKPIDPSHLE
jgi:hypothetical protein